MVSASEGEVAQTTNSQTGTERRKREVGVCNCSSIGLLGYCFDEDYMIRGELIHRIYVLSDQSKNTCLIEHKRSNYFSKFA